MQYIKMVDTAKAVLGGNFIALKSYIRKEKHFQMRILAPIVAIYKKKTKNKPKASRRKASTKGIINLKQK